MSKKTQSSGTKQSLNPFPSSAVARLSPTATELLTITTDAVRKAVTYLDEYLARGGTVLPVESESIAGGNVIAIIGEYGTGKTHIALELLKRIRDQGAADLHAFYLDAPADTFLALYKDRFIPKLHRREVRNRVEGYFADIVAEELGKSILTTETAKLLKSRELPPLELVRKLGLMESEFMGLLQSELRQVTEHEDFGTAFTLFLRPEFEDAVWEWLRGNPPDDALVDRGIQRTLDSDPAVLEAIGVVAFLFGRQNHRFILVVDEMEKVLSHSTPYAPDESTLLAFKKFMEAIGKTRALLILGGLPDFLETLPDDAKQRVSCIVRPTALTAEDTSQYIREAQRIATGRERLKPFTKDTIAYVSEIAGGNARKVVRLCYHAFQSAQAAGTDVTRAMLREAAREQFELSTTEDVSTEIARTIDLNGWLFEIGKDFGKSKKLARADYWIPVGDKGNGCVIFLARSVLHEKDVEGLTGQIKRVRNQEVQHLGILVINGYLAENLAPLLEKAFDRVLVYSFRRFAEDIDAALKGLVRRIEEGYREDNVALIRDRVEQIARQATATRSSVQELEDSISRNLINPSMLERSVERGVRAIFGQLGGHSSKSSDSRFPGITEVFDDADTVLRANMVRVEGLIDQVFQSIFSDNMANNIEYRHGFDLITRERDLARYLGTLQIFQRAIDSFRTSLFEELSKIRTLHPKERAYHVRELQEHLHHTGDAFFSLTRDLEMADMENFMIRFDGKRTHSPMLDLVRLSEFPRDLTKAIDHEVNSIL